MHIVCNVGRLTICLSIVVRNNIHDTVDRHLFCERDGRQFRTVVGFANTAVSDKKTNQAFVTSARRGARPRNRNPHTSLNTTLDYNYIIRFRIYHRRHRVTVNRPRSIHNLGPILSLPATLCDISIPKCLDNSENCRFRFGQEF